MRIQVIIEDRDGSCAGRYVFSYKDKDQRQVFAAQSRNALQAGQKVTTYRVDASAEGEKDEVHHR